MREQVAAAIYRAVQSCGNAVLTTPRTLAHYIARETPARPVELAAIVAAQEIGLVDRLQTDAQADRATLAATLAERARVPPGVARWAVETWATALAAITSGHEPNVPDMDGLRHADQGEAAVGPFRRQAGAVVLVLLVGALFGGLPGLLVTAGIASHNAQAVRVRQLLARREPPGQSLRAPELGRWLFRLGALGGLVGAGLGWMTGGFAEASSRRMAVSVLGVAWAFDGAVFGLAHAGLVGVLYGALVAATAGVALATLLGRFGWLVGIKPALWLLVAHF